MQHLVLSMPQAHSVFYINVYNLPTLPPNLLLLHEKHLKPKASRDPGTLAAPSLLLIL